MTAVIKPANDTQVQIAILGAGPTGLGAAWRLTHAKERPRNGTGHLEKDVPHPPDSGSNKLEFQLIDELPYPGGRAASHTTPEGFVFDYGGHVLFPHKEYKEFTQVLDQVVSEWHSSVPVRGVWTNRKLIPKPVQRNIHRLPLPVMAACLWGLWRKRPSDESDVEPNLQEYLVEQFGHPMTKHLMGPLNTKMWAHPAEALGSDWSSHRSGSKEKNIAEVNIRDVLTNLVLNRDLPGWTSDTIVRYPLVGGMGLIWDRVFAMLPEPSRRLGTRVKAIDATAKRVLLNDGSSVQYEQLVTSIPLDVLLRSLVDQPVLRAKADNFKPAKVQLFGFGLKGPIPDVLKGVHGFNIPSSDIPFWRVTLPSNISPGNAPAGDDVWSILCENSIPPDSDEYVSAKQIETSLRKVGFLLPETKIISTFETKIAHGYPAPFYGRDKFLNEAQEQLEKLDIYSRGRFGGWRYEVSNQDHAFMQGVEVIDRIRDNKPEYTYKKTW